MQFSIFKTFIPARRVDLILTWICLKCRCRYMCKDRASSVRPRTNAFTTYVYAFNSRAIQNITTLFFPSQMRTSLYSLIHIAVAAVAAAPLYASQHLINQTFLFYFSDSWPKKSGTSKLNTLLSSSSSDSQRTAAAVSVVSQLTTAAVHRALHFSLINVTAIVVVVVVFEYTAVIAQAGGIK